MDLEQIVAAVTKEVLARVQAPQAAKAGGADIAHTIEHSILNPDTTRETVVRSCGDAREYGFACVCVSPYYVPLAARELKGSRVRVCTVAGFPHGAASTAAKVAEAREAAEGGAREIDVALNILAVKNGEVAEAIRDFAEVVRAVRGRLLVKAIYEQGLYTDEEKVRALHVAREAGADYVKISNALTGKKAAAEDVRFVRGILGPSMGIKIDGGISDAETVRALMAAGANRFGCSKSVQIVRGAE